MRRSEFERAVRDEFGTYGSSLISDLVLTRAGGLTADQALNAGYSPRDVWLALCEEMDVPGERRYGVGRLEPKR
ncbi:DUF3046 domain-containing protein [Microbacterium sp. HJ5]